VLAPMSCLDTCAHFHQGKSLLSSFSLKIYHSSFQILLLLSSLVHFKTEDSRKLHFLDLYLKMRT
jgi:hypothetical protein